MNNLCVLYVDNLYVFNSDEDVEECLLKMSNIQQLLEEGQKEELIELLNNIVRSEEFKEQEEEIQTFIKQGLDQAMAYDDVQGDQDVEYLEDGKELDTQEIQIKEDTKKYNEEQEQAQHEPEQQQDQENKLYADDNQYASNENENFNNENINYDSDEGTRVKVMNPNFADEMATEYQRYPDAKQLKEMLDENVQKMKARVQLLQVTEQKNLFKAKQLDKNAERLQKNKETRFYKQVMKQQFQDQKQVQYNKKREEIRIQKEKHKQILQDKRGMFGEKHQKNVEDIKKYKAQIRQGYEQTLQSVYIENKQLHNKVTGIHKSQSMKLQSLWDQKMIMAQHNYKMKVKQEISQANLRQDELEELERYENKMLQRLKITQQIYQNSSNKYKEIKEIPYQDIIKI